MVEYDRDSEMVAISPNGNAFVENELLSKQRAPGAA
jgi:hypothetical protein